ncbi:MAG: DUF177 domain-containing protein [Cyclobacteriaceae bacterium]|nr:DUF177 domain-containing protein [Cyclobacteriaceae bacterium]
MREFAVNIIGLTKKAHLFNFRLEKGFFEKYGSDAVADGRFDVEVVLDKKETFIEVEFKISGKAALVCDRTLEPFDFPVNETHKVVFKYGDEAQELTDEIVIITRDQDSIDLGQFFYEFIALAIPMKKLHPRFANEAEDDQLMVYSTAQNETETEQDENDSIDPRWEKLKKLK